MDGTPESTFIAVRIVLMKKLRFLVYSLRKIAVIMPMGTEIKRLKTTV